MYADEMGYGDFGAYNDGYVQTPNLDALIGENHCLSQHYSGSRVRSPAWAALLTGRFWQWNKYQAVGATNAAMLEGYWKLGRPRMDIQYASPNDEEAHKLCVQKNIEQVQPPALHKRDAEPRPSTADPGPAGPRAKQSDRFPPLTGGSNASRIGVLVLGSQRRTRHRPPRNIVLK